MQKQSKQTLPRQHQDIHPGREHLMMPRPRSEARAYKAANKLEKKRAIITGGDSGIGRSVAVTFAKEGADVAIVYLKEHRDADETRRLVEDEGRRCLLIPGDVGQSKFCRKAVQETVKKLGGLDILVNNAAEQHVQKNFENISDDQLLRTFQTNIFAYFYMARECLKHIGDGGAIINTASITAYQGHPQLIDYSATKGAIVAFTRSLAMSLAEKNIRVNGVAPGPIWTPLIPSTFDEEKVSKFGSETPMKRPGQPDEVAPCYVFLACEDSSYITGQMLHPNGGRIVNG